MPVIILPYPCPQAYRIPVITLTVSDAHDGLAAVDGAEGDGQDVMLHHDIPGDTSSNIALCPLDDNLIEGERYNRLSCKKKTTYRSAKFKLELRIREPVSITRRS